jgi:uncharacterized protein (DUF1778 family)
MSAMRAATLELRLTPKQKNLIREAANTRGQSMTEFILSTVEPVAEALVEREHVITLSRRGWQEFVEMLENPRPLPHSTLAEMVAFMAKYHPAEPAQ